MGVYTLHLSDSQFWHLTLAQFDALIERHIQEQENLDVRAALICTTLANIYRDPKKRRKAFEVQDFMPQRRPKRKKSEEQVKDELMALNIALGGEIK